MTTLARKERILLDTKTFVTATNGRLKWWLHHTLEDLSPERLDYRTPLFDDRPIAEVAMHTNVILLGNALVATGKQWSLEDYPLEMFRFCQDTLNQRGIHVDQAYLKQMEGKGR